MPWVRFDDGFASHAKVVRLSDAAFRLHVSAICYSNHHLTDGLVTTGVARTLLRERNPQRAIVELLRARLWEATTEDETWQIHDYQQYQPSRAQVEHRKNLRAAAGRLGGLASAKARARLRLLEARDKQDA